MIWACETCGSTDVLIAGSYCQRRRKFIESEDASFCRACDGDCWVRRVPLHKVLSREEQATLLRIYQEDREGCTGWSTYFDHRDVNTLRILAHEGFLTETCMTKAGYVKGMSFGWTDQGRKYVAMVLGGGA